MPWFLAFSLPHLGCFLEQLHLLSCFLIAIVIDRGSIGINLVSAKEFVWRLKFESTSMMSITLIIFFERCWWKWLSRFTDFNDHVYFYFRYNFSKLN